MSISYSKSFLDLDGDRRFHRGATNVGSQNPSVLGDLIDPNLRHQWVSVPIAAGQAGTYCLTFKKAAVGGGRANAMVAIDFSRNPVAPNNVEIHSATQKIYDFGLPDWQGRTWVGLMDQTYTDAREIYWCTSMAVGDQISGRFWGLCELVRIPRDPNSVKTEHLRLGIRSEFPGQQFHQEGLGTYRRITMSWERLGADDLAVLDEAYHTVPTLEAPVVLWDDTDPQGAAYGRFIGFDWSSGAFELTFDAQMVFEEIVTPR